MTQFPETSLSLIARVKDPADDVAWGEFLGIYQPVVYRMAKRRGMQDADAQDVVQQVFLSIATSIPRWTPGDDRPPFRAWLTTIARNAITKALSRRPQEIATGSTSVAEVLLCQPDRADATDEIRTEARLELVRWAIEQIRHTLTQPTWEIFVRTMIDDEGIADVAESTGRSVGAIYVLRHRILARLRTTISELSENWELAEEQRR
jgi:RNA polymerase sigma-70 factor (ECF subfamily)